MASIVSQTQLDSPVSSPLEDSGENHLKVSDVNLTVSEDRSRIEETLADNASFSRTHPLRTTCAKGVAKNLYAAQTPGWLISKPSDWTVASAKKRRKVVGKGKARMNVADDPASVLLIKKLRHDDLMELHDHFKTKTKDVATVVLSKIKITTHGLAPLGMSIPAEGNAYVTGGGINTDKEPLMESNLERYNRFKEEEEVTKKKKEKKEVKKLKNDGKVRTLAPYMYS